MNIEDVAGDRLRPSTCSTLCKSSAYLRVRVLALDGLTLHTVPGPRGARPARDARCNAGNRPKTSTNYQATEGERKHRCRINMYTRSNVASPEVLTLQTTMPPNSAGVANPSCQAYQHLNCMVKHKPIYLRFSFVQLVRLCFPSIRIPLDSRVSTTTVTSPHLSFEWISSTTSATGNRSESVHPFEDRIRSADAGTVLLVLCLCVASLGTGKNSHNKLQHTYFTKVV
jgi:hypothetical protein